MDEEELAMTAAIKVEVEINEEPGEVNLESEKEEFWDNTGTIKPGGLSIEPIWAKKGKSGSTNSSKPGSLRGSKNNKTAKQPKPAQANEPVNLRRGRSKKLPAVVKKLTEEEDEDEDEDEDEEDEEPARPVKKPAPQEKIFKCTECEKAFARKDNCVRHIRSHSGIKRFECPICKFKYSDKGALQYHLRTHSGEKPHQCAECGKCFTSKGDLSRHSMVHSGIRPYECDICHMAFTQSGHLTQHKRSHTGEKPFECPICNKNFTLRTNLSQHVRLHSGVRPYECEVCQKTFSQRAHLTRHKGLHMRDADDSASKYITLKNSVP